MGWHKQAEAPSLAELDRLCHECRESIAAQPHGVLKESMEEACVKCKKVRAHLPDLLALRKHLHEMTEKFPDDEVA